jgi:hypothetical protein
MFAHFMAVRDELGDVHVESVGGDRCAQKVFVFVGYYVEFFGCDLGRVFLFEYCRIWREMERKMRERESV